MLSTEAVVARTGGLSWQQSDHLLHLCKSSASTESSSSLNVTELCTGLERGNVLLKDSVADISSSKVICSAEIMVQYIPTTGEHRVFSLATNTLLDVARKPMSSSNHISAACEPRIENGFFLFACEDDSLYAIMVRKNRSSQETAGQKMTCVSPSMRLEKSEDNKLEKPQGKISKLVAHPTLPVVFVVFSKGAVQAWSYEKLYRQMQTDLQDRNAPQDDQDPSLEAGEGDALSEEGEGEVATKRKQQTKKFNNLTPLGTLARPSPDELGVLHSSLSTAFPSATSLTIHPDGSSLALIWGQCVVLLYSLAALQKIHCAEAHSLTISFSSAFPLVVAQPTTGAATAPLVAAARNPGVSLYSLSARDAESEDNVEHKFSHVAFHPLLPVVWLVVSRRKLSAKLPGLLSALHRSARTENTLAFNPLPPLVVALSILGAETQMLLPCLGAEVLNPAVLCAFPSPTANHNMFNSRSMSMNLSPATCGVTQSGGLILSFRLLRMEAEAAAVFVSATLAEGFLVSTGLVSWLRPIHAPLVAKASSLGALLFPPGPVPKSSGAPVGTAWAELAGSAEEGLFRSLAVVAPPAIGLAAMYSLVLVDPLVERAAAAAAAGGDSPDAIEHVYSPSVSALLEIPVNPTSTICTEFVKQTYSWLKLDKEDYILLRDDQTVELPDLGPNSSAAAGTLLRRLRDDPAAHFFFPQEVRGMCEVGRGKLLSVTKGVMLRNHADPTRSTFFGVGAMYAQSLNRFVPATLLARTSAEDSASNTQVLLAFRDVVVVPAQTSTLLLGLCAEGTSVKFLTRGAEDQDAIRTDVSVSLGFVAKAIHVLSSPQSLSLVFVEEGPTAEAMRLYHHDSGTLDVSTLQAILSGPATACALLDPHEQVLEMCVQGSDCLSAHPLTAFLHELSAEPMLAVRTSERVIVLRTPSLRPICAVEHGYRSLSSTSAVVAVRSSNGAFPSTPASALKARIQQLLEFKAVAPGTPGLTAAAGMTGTALLVASREHLPVTVVQVRWAGSALLIVGRDNCCRYWLPLEARLIEEGQLRSFQSVATIRQKLCAANLHRTASLWSLPVNLSPRGPAVLVALYSDRAVYLYMDAAGAGRLTVRPVHLLEPLLLGVVAARTVGVAADAERLVLPPSVAGSRPVDQVWRELAMYLIYALGPPGSADGLAHSPLCVSRLLALDELGLSGPDRAGITSGLQGLGLQCAEVLLHAKERLRLMGQHGTEDFPRERHLSAAAQALVLHKVLAHPVAILPIYMQACPLLVDLLLGHETFGGRDMPQFGDIVSRQGLDLAMQLPPKSIAGSPFTMRLLDVCGAQFAMLEALAAAPDLADDLHALVQELVSAPPLSHREVSALRAVLPQLTDPALEAQVRGYCARAAEEVELVNVTRSRRPRSLSQIHQRRLPALEQELQACIHSAGAGAGAGVVPLVAARGLRSAARELLEDLLGVASSIETSLPANAAAGGLFGSTAGGEGALRDEEAFFPTLPRPPHWLEGVGQGREAERCGLYVRFSDAAVPTAAHDAAAANAPATGPPLSLPFNGGVVAYSNSAQPSAQLAFLNLNKFDGPALELFARTDEQLQRYSLAGSSSAIDPGDKHDTVKSLNDLVCSAAQAVGAGAEGPPARVETGLRCAVVRGQALDVGLYHTAPSRLRVSYELFLWLDHASVAQALQAGREVTLLQRCTYDAQQRRAAMTSLLRLFISTSGALCVQLDAATAPLQASVSLTQLLDLAGAGASDPACDGNGNGDGDDPSASFLHICLQLDGTSARFEATGSNPETTILRAAEPVGVLLVVNGEAKLRGRAPAAAVPAAALDTTLLFVMPDGTDARVGYKLTELRVFAGARALTDLDSQRSTYLPGASKRARLQMQWRNTKKLFLPYRSLGLPEHVYVGPLLLQHLSIDEVPAEVAPGPAAGAAAAARVQGVNPRPLLALGAATVAPAPAVSATDPGAGTGSLAAPDSAGGDGLNAKQRRLLALKNKQAAPASASGAGPTAGLTKSAPLGVATGPVAEFVAFPPAPPTDEVTTSKGPPPTAHPAPSAAPSVLFEEVLRLGGEDSKRLRARLGGALADELRGRALHVPVVVVTQLAGDLATLRQHSPSGVRTVDLSRSLPPTTAAADLQVVTGPSSATRVLVYSAQAGSLHVLDLADPPTPTSSPLASLALGQHRLLLAHFITSDLLLLLLDGDGFTWKVAMGAKPVKVLTRVDLADPKLWRPRIVLQASVLQAEGCTALLTGPATGDIAEGDRLGVTVSLHHAKSGKALLLHGLAVAFCAPKRDVLWVAASGCDLVLLVADLQELLAQSPTQPIDPDCSVVVGSEEASAGTAVAAGNVPLAVRTRLVLSGAWPAEESAQPTHGGCAPSLPCHVFVVADRVFVLTRRGVLHVLALENAMVYGAVSLRELAGSTAHPQGLLVLQAVMDVAAEPTLLVLFHADAAAPKVCVARVSLKEVVSRAKAQYKAALQAKQTL